MTLSQKVAGKNALTRLVALIKDMFLLRSGGTMTGKLNFNVPNSSISTVGIKRNLSLSSMFNEICMSGMSDTELWVNYRKNHLEHAPSVFRWGDGSLGGFASHEIQSLTAHGTVEATTITQTSDRMQKRNIRAICKDDVSRIRAVRLVEYRFKKDKSNRKRYGVIAQDLEKAGLRCLVLEGEDGKKTVDYISMLCLKIEELTARIEALKSGVPMESVKAEEEGGIFRRILRACTNNK